MLFEKDQDNATIGSAIFLVIVDSFAFLVLWYN